MNARVIRSALTLTLLASLAAAAGAQEAKHKPIVAGGLVVNPHDIIAVYRPIDQQAVAVFVGRPGQGVQAIVIKDSKEAAAVFNDIWNNAEVTKDPGDDDARPLTRMRLKDAEQKTATLIANVQRILAVVWERDRRQARVYVDKLITGELLVDPNGNNDSREYLEIQNAHDEAESVMAAYKACVYRR